jgi:hypothetical protein
LPASKHLNYSTKLGLHEGFRSLAELPRRGVSRLIDALVVSLQSSNSISVRKLIVK